MMWKILIETRDSRAVECIMHEITRTIAEQRIDVFLVELLKEAE